MATEKPFLREILEALLVAVLFATFARTYVVQAFKIPTGSMEENLLVGDHILVNKFIYGEARTGLERRLLPLRPVRRGDVVVFKYPEDPARDFIKRCVGLPGDTVEIVDKQLYLNGRAVAEEGYTYHADERTFPRSPALEAWSVRDNFGPYVVPPAHYFCLGDNRDNSRDSRVWGPVPESHVKGRAFMVYWSTSEGGETYEWPGLAGKLRQLGRLARHFASATRWERTFEIVR
ncbi:MAG TPA: signal peptidase I [Thermoanaerobaculia bacterium]|nr:signal peptidase I [Thermoanaerobaculia bacterium]